MIEVGRKNRYGIVEAVSKDERLVALYDRCNMGKKGKIMAINTEDYANSRLLMTSIDGKWYHLIEYCNDMPELMRRFNWYLTSAKSAYREEK